MRYNLSFSILLITILFTINSFSQEVPQLNLEEYIDHVLSNSNDVKIKALIYKKAQLEYSKTRTGLIMPNLTLSGTIPNYSQSSQQALRYDDQTDLWEEYTIWVERTTYNGALSLNQSLFTGGQLRVSANGSQYSSSSRNTDEVNVGANISIDQPLFVSNSFKSQMKSAKRQLDVAKTDYSNSLKQIRQDAIQRYLQILIAQKKLNTEEESIEILKNKYEMDKTKFDQNLLSELELLESEININNSLNALRQYKDEYHVSLQNLKNSLPPAFSDTFQLMEPEIVLPKIDWEHYLNQSLENSPDISAKKNSLNNLKRILEDAHDKNNLNINLSGRYGFEGNGTEFSEALDNFRELENKNLSMSVSVNMPLWDGGAISKEIQIAKTDYEIAKLELEQMEKDIAKQLKEQIMSVHRLEFDLNTQKMNIQLLEKKLNIAQNQYDYGILSIETLMENREAYVGGFTNFWTNYINYQSAIWEIEKILGITIIQ